MKTRSSILFFLIPAVLLTFGCKKISTPDEDSKLIFGQWEYSYDSGGISGSGGSTTFKDDSWVEFSEKGVYEVYEGSKKVERLRFKIEPNDGNAKYKINFSSSGVLDYYYVIEDNKLILRETGSDGFSYVFIKK
jgi:hypothetical protein